ncbi:MAG: DUF924 family protein [Pseudomonadales bacterium]
MPERISEIIEFWIGQAASDPEAAAGRNKLWYKPTKETDDTIRRRFGLDLARAEAGELATWATTPGGSLALVILLDQFSRNLYRGTAKAYANDTMALDIALDAINSGKDQDLSLVGRAFLYHPLHHSEQIEVQDWNIRLFESLLAEAGSEWEELISGFLHFAKEHRDVIRRFGRFPHRNVVLKRTSTNEEQAYLEGGANRYGQ